MSLLEVADVQSGYGTLPILHGVSLSVREGEVVGIIGPNGAGKSTLMKTIYRLLPLTAGSVHFDGKDLSDADPREVASLGMGFVPQERNTFPDLSVEDNLNVSLLGGRRGAAAEARDGVYERFPALAERRRQPASTLSGGERQMLALAAAMVTSPRLLALDEPTTGLAPSIVQRLIEQILEFRSAGTTVLWVIEENPLQILEHVDRVYLVQAGSIHRELAASELLADETLRELFFGTAAEHQQASPTR